MRTLAIITARGGSKRIPRKNIRLFCGKPMIQYAIEAAQKAECFDVIMVSTDDREIAEISIRLGADVPFLRSSRTADDHATTSDVLTEVLIEYQKMGEVFDFVCCIYPCVPFLRSDRVRRSLVQLKAGAADVIYPVCKYSTPVERALIQREDGTIGFWMPQYASMRSQDLSAKFFDTGQFYFFRSDVFLSNGGNLSAGRVLPLVIEEVECQDIDTLDDWEMAELKLEILNRKNLCSKEEK